MKVKKAVSGGGPAGVLFFPVQTYVLQQKAGLRKAIWLGTSKCSMHHAC